MGKPKFKLSDKQKIYLENLYWLTSHVVPCFEGIDNQFKEILEFGNEPVEEPVRYVVFTYTGANNFVAYNNMVGANTLAEAEIIIKWNRPTRSVIFDIDCLSFEKEINTPYNPSLKNYVDKLESVKNENKG